jgi:uncharacterized membrane protein
VTEESGERRTSPIGAAAGRRREGGWRSRPPSGPTTSLLEPVNVVYLLYLLGYLFPLSALVGLIVAYMQRRTAPPAILSHHTWQIRTFWIGLLWLVVGGLLTPLFVGWFVWLAWLIWSVVRIVGGMGRYARHEPIPDPESWRWA